MPSGDAQRTWFPEMVDVLRCDWERSMSMVKLIELRHRLDAMLQSIRSERGILPAVMTCPSCGSKGHAAPPRVSVRAVILSLGRFGMASVEDVRDLQKLWNRYRRDEQLDLYGAQEAERKTPGGADRPPAPCHH